MHDGQFDINCDAECRPNRDQRELINISSMVASMSSKLWEIHDYDDGNMAMMKMITMVMIMTMITYLGGLPINGNCGKVEEGAN